MSVRLVIDMNLSPEWAVELAKQGFTAVHWSLVGDVRANDLTIMSWARANKHVVFTHDLDFGALLALTHAKGPSVIQVRSRNVFPDIMGAAVVAALRQHEDVLKAGALVVVEISKSRVRILPL